MAQEAHGAIYDLLAVRGVSRRDFMKYCGYVAAMLGLTEAAAPQIAAAVEKGAKLKPALWLNGGSCTGCTESMAQVDSPDVATIVLELLSLNYFETIMAAAGEYAEKNVDDTIEAGNYLLIYEGAVMMGEDGNTLLVNGHKGKDILEKAAAGAQAILAVGACAVDGGWVYAHPNPAGGIGVQSFLDSVKVATPVVNLPCCPTSPEWVVAMVVQWLLVAEDDPATFLDKTALLAKDYRDNYRDADVTLLYPEYIVGSTIHDNCPRRGHFENGEFVTEFGSPEEAMGYCLYKVGCKGPQTYTQCPITRWNRSVSWCVQSGAPCIGCGGLNWVDNNAPFFKRLSSMQMGDTLGNVQPGSVGAVVGGVAAAALVAHGLGMKAAGRIGDGPPMEDMKVHDRKRMKKGGDK
ncbi:hydrogenase small subunit [Anaerosoma tenue]|uniref:hydrogenase small subunit n=1 Tax=Anaerosoma tenue TaxID=2933588 RepID=UPI002260B764|nr:hydrogenase small subunit [Anaerosoma tenue]MCK8113993.1 hydrogenase small subunit [Anaerosoma tenue]